MKTFEQIVSHLESLSIMPKEMPGIEKIKNALARTAWFSKIDPKKVIVVAGTNGKGSTCAILEALLVSADKKVGFYSSPHLIDTTERIRVNKNQISKNEFVKLYQDNETLITKFELTHFEALTLMAADYFFNRQNLDYALFEVGLGGTFDATNAIPHATSVVTALGLDHTNILGNTIQEIAKNKFGIIQKSNLVIHHQLPTEVLDLKKQIEKETNSKWFQAETVKLEIQKSSLEPVYILETKWGNATINLPGDRAAQNAATALTVLAHLGFNPKEHLHALNEVRWNGRMQKVTWPNMQAAFYLSGDHNVQGVQSLLKILNDFTYENLHLVVGIGKDKDLSAMLNHFLQLPNISLYLTETPFKGLPVDEYPERFQAKAILKDKDPTKILDAIAKKTKPTDLVIVTGSLYLVGEVLKVLKN